jgi:hypothetical protein
MPDHASPNVFDYSILVLYLVASVAFGFWVSRRGVIFLASDPAPLVLVNAQALNTPHACL